MSTDKIGLALAAFAPVLEALIVSAERTGAAGKDKHAAVATAAEQVYGALQSSVKEIRGVPWAAVGPIIVPITGGLISVVVNMWNRLSGKVWSFFASEDKPGG